MSKALSYGGPGPGASEQPPFGTIITIIAWIQEILQKIGRNTMSSLR